MFPYVFVRRFTEEDQSLFSKVQRDNNDEGNVHRHTCPSSSPISPKAKIQYYAEVECGYRAGTMTAPGHGHGSGLSTDFMVDKATEDKLSTYVAKNIAACVYYQI